MSEAIKELDILFAQGKPIKVNGVDLVIKSFKMGQLPRVFKALEPLSEVLATSYTGSQLQLVSKMLAASGDSVITLLEVGSGQPREWVEDLDMEQSLELATAIMEVNSNFFLQRVLPILNKNMEKAQSLKKSSGAK